MKLRLLLLCMLALPAVSAWAYSFSAPNDDGIEVYYDINKETPDCIAVTYCKATNPVYSGIVVIPETVTYNGKEYKVTAIGSRAFWNCVDLVSLIYPSTVTSIGYDAFKGCTGLSEFTISNSITEIGSGAFNNCTGLTSLTIGNSVSVIGSDTFWNCSGLTEIKIPDSVVEIGSTAFYHCTELVSVSIGNSVVKIGDGAFSGCVKLTSVTIPSSVTEIGGAAFNGCEALTDVILSDGTQPLYIGEWVFYPCPLETLYVGRDVVFTGYQGSPFLQRYTLKSLTFGETVTVIGESAFAYCIELTEVVIPNSVKSIRGGAFSKCDKLSVVKLGQSVDSIGSSAFSGCKALNSITLPESLTSIGSSAFSDTGIYNDASNWQDNCLYISNWLTNVKYLSNTDFVVKDGTRGIAAFAYNEIFIGSKRLTSVTIPNSVKYIGEGTFVGCTDLKGFYGKFASPDNRCLIIDGYLVAFAPAGLTSYSIPETVKAIGWSVFYHYDKLESVKIPDTVTSIAQTAFLECRGLKSIRIPDSVTEMKDGIFRYCTGLMSVIVGNSLETIDYQTFYGCTSLNYVEIGESVNVVGERAFWGCTGLTKIWSRNPVPPVCKYSEVFSPETFEMATLHVPAQSIEDYKTAYTWKEFLTVKDETDAGIETIEADAESNVTISAEGDLMRLCGTVEGDRLMVYSLDGRLLYAGKALAGSTTIPVALRKGSLYFVNLGSATFKYMF